MTAPKLDVHCGAVAANTPGACLLPPHSTGRHCDAEGQTWAHDFKYGRPDVYEITWMSGHIERVMAHQLTYPNQGLAMAGLFSHTVTSDVGAPRIRMHAEIDGHWCLTLAAREEDIRTMRLVTADEPIPGGTA